MHTQPSLGSAPSQEAGHSSTTLPEGPLALVLAPTRELAMQVAHQARHVRSLTGLRTACVYGGVTKEAQVSVEAACVCVLMVCEQVMDVHTWACA